MTAGKNKKGRLTCTPVPRNTQGGSSPSTLALVAAGADALRPAAVTRLLLSQVGGGRIVTP